MNENEKAYRKVENYYREDKSSSFGKSIFVPFLSGVLGSVLVVGTCFGVPSIKSTLLGNSNNHQIAPASVTNNQPLNTSYVSLSSFSDTAVGVARKNTSFNC